LKKGTLEIPVGEAWLKSLTIKGGIVPLRQYQPALKRLIESGRAKPSFIFDRELRIKDAPEAYKEFSDHDFIKSVIRLDDNENGSLIEEEESEEKAPTQKKRKRNGVHA
jgi:threonine dehydrogenase-like Zn-dependent dehydrogenase